MQKDDNISMNREINILDMIYYVASKWKSVLIAALFFMVLACLYSYTSSRNVIEAKKQLENSPIELDADELSDVQAYASYKNIYESLQTYQQESPWMNMDTDSYYEADMQYYIKLDENELNDTETGSLQNAIIFAYKRALTTDAFCQKLKEVVGEDVKSEYYSEIIDAENVLKKKAYNNTLMITTSSGLLNVTVRTKDEEQTKQVKDLVKDAFASQAGTVEAQIFGHKLLVLDDEVLEKDSNDIYQYQKYINNLIKEVVTKIDEIEKTLTLQQKTYYEQNYMQVENTVQEENSVAAPKPTVNKKLVVVGFLLGFILLCGFYAVIYLLNSRLMLEDDFEKIYGQKLICRVTTNLQDVKMFVLDKLLLRIRRAGILTFNEEDALPMIVTNIKIACKKSNVFKVVLSVNKVSDKSFVQKVADALNKAGVNAIVGESVLYDYKTLEEASDNAHILLFEQAGCSDYLTIQQEIEICKHSDISMIGAVVVDK